jgi:tRNA U34 5-methylaminomethyl-2-thiouridine-forming methyltransferase MnmC
MEPQYNDPAASPVIITTDDGSHTLSVPSLGESYHSRFGAIQESRHVFLEHGFHATGKSPLRILETGFGTGLNALLTLLAAGETGRKVFYTALELYPVPVETISQLNYPRLLETGEEIFLRMHSLPWEKDQPVTEHFTLLKIRDDLVTCNLKGPYDLVYFDAFSAEAQPELWTPQVFQKIGRTLTPGAILVTYAAKGSVRRALEQSGFRVERLPGPPGKREMIRAVWKDER